MSQMPSGIEPAAYARITAWAVPYMPAADVRMNRGTMRDAEGRKLSARMTTRRASPDRMLYRARAEPPSVEATAVITAEDSPYNAALRYGPSPMPFDAKSTPVM